MSDPVIRRVRQSIDEARNRNGMQAGMPKVTIDAADAERLCIVAEALTAPQPAPDVAALVEALEIFVASPTPTSEDFDRANAALAAHRKGDQP